MSTDRFGALHQRIQRLFGEESFGDRESKLLGDVFDLAQQFRETALQQGEALLDQAEECLVKLVAHRAKLVQHSSSGASWEDLEDVREKVTGLADEYSDELAEHAEELISLLEDRRADLEENNQARFAGSREWARFERWVEARMERTREFAEELVEQFDEEAAEISQG